MRALQQENRELNQQLDDDGQHFLEALLSLEREIEDLNLKNSRLAEDRARVEAMLKAGGDDTKLQRKLLRMEQDLQDVLAQQSLFEEEKEDEIRTEQDQNAQMRVKLAEGEKREEDYERQLQQLRLERDQFLDLMTEEGEEQRSRIEKLERDKESLHLQLAEALARADVASLGSRATRDGAGASEAQGDLAEASWKMRTLMGEREDLKDEVVRKEGQLILLQSHLEISNKKLTLADIEITMLKSELEACRKRQGGPEGEASLPQQSSDASPKVNGGHVQNGLKQAAARGL